MTYEKFMAQMTVEWYRRPPYIREGQALMNHLWDVWPEEYKRITATGNDCFYRDDIIPKTIEHLQKEWVKYPN